MGYTVKSCGGACPTQAEGQTDDGKDFYFRYRHGVWTLRASHTDVYSCEPIACDRLGDSLDGYMSDQEVFAILDNYLGANNAG